MYPPRFGATINNGCITVEIEVSTREDRAKSSFSERDRSVTLSPGPSILLWEKSYEAWQTELRAFSVYRRSTASTGCRCKLPVADFLNDGYGIQTADVRLLHAVGGPPTRKWIQGADKGCFREEIHGS